MIMTVPHPLHKTSRGNVSLAGGAVGGIAGFVFYYDKRTAHPLRQMQDFKWHEGWVRFCNMTRPNFTFPEIALHTNYHVITETTTPPDTMFQEPYCTGMLCGREGSQCGLG